MKIIAALFKLLLSLLKADSGTGASAGSAKKSPLPKGESARPPATAAPLSDIHPLHWPSRGDFEFEVVGESHYQPAIRALYERPESTFTADLIPEANNPHDRNAVRVEIEGKTVGYLGREDAASFRRRLTQKRLTGCTTQCAATVSGGYERRGRGITNLGVLLDIKPFD